MNCTTQQPQLFNQIEFNDLVCGMDFPITSVKLLGLRLKKKHLLQPGTTFFLSSMRKNFSQFFEAESDFVFCNNISGLLSALGCKFVISDWIHFIYSPKQSLKCVFCMMETNFSQFPSVSLLVLKKLGYIEADFEKY